MHYLKKESYNILFIEPFNGGSHKDFLKGIITHSRHNIDSLTMKDRFWKWRMRGASLYLLGKIKNFEKYHGIIVSDMINLADLKAICPSPFPPSMVYFHENQLTYPLSPGEVMDYQYGFTNIITALCADRILFNSKFHYDDFFSELSPFIKMMPDYRPLWTIENIKKKAAILYPGCHLKGSICGTPQAKDKVPLIIWNHRWEHDKNPALFFNTLEKLSEKKINFKLALLGENYGTIPVEFKRAQKTLRDKMVQYGYSQSKETYFDWLKQGDIIISTAFQENFGISVVEAMASGCFPLLPKRLSYPELIHPSFHSKVLYTDDHDFAVKLEYLLTHLSEFKKEREHIAQSMQQFSWENMILQYDKELTSLCMKQY